MAFGGHEGVVARVVLHEAENVYSGLRPETSSKSGTGNSGCPMVTSWPWKRNVPVRSCVNW